MEKELYELKEILVDELKKYGKKGELSTGSLEIVDKLAHATKNLGKVIEMCEGSEEYSNARGGSYTGSYGRSMSMADGSYARGRGANAARDSRGRYSSEGYSRDGDFMMKLEELMGDAPDTKTRMDMEKILSKLNM